MFHLFQFDLKKAILVAFVVALPLLSINIQRGPDEPPWYAQPFSYVAGNIQNGYASFSQGVRGTVALYLNLIDIKVDNRLLKKEIAELKAQLGQMAELSLENERLNKLLNFQQQAPMKLLAARVTGQDLLRDHRTIRINRGTEEGIVKGLAVITFEGAVGYVLNAEPHSSQVLVITDRYAVVDALIQRTRARGIVAGAAIDRCRLKYLHRADDVVEGDVIVTSGLDNIFPKGFPIATVVGVEKKNYGITQKVDLRPIVDPSRLEEVFVVLHVDNAKIPDVNEPKPDAALPAAVTTTTKSATVTPTTTKPTKQ
ncbi:MAG: rod shape-determining protein MreC [Bdellovibrionales bacterium]